MLTTILSLCALSVLALWCVSFLVFVRCCITAPDYRPEDFKLDGESEEEGVID